LEIKINNNNEKLLNFIQYVDEKFQSLKTFYEFFDVDNSHNSLFFFSILLFVVWLITFFKSFKKNKLILNLIVIIFFFIERFIIFSFSKNPNKYNVDYISYSLMFYFLRFFYILSILIFILIKSQHNKKKEDESLKLENIITECNSLLLNMTPMWMKKYFSKIKIQNEYLIEKFNLMEDLMEREKKKIYKRIECSPHNYVN